MKKVLLALVVVATMGFSSCKKCYKCSYGNGFASEVCQGQNQTNSEFKDAVDELEDDGYICK